MARSPGTMKLFIAPLDVGHGIGGGVRTAEVEVVAVVKWPDAAPTHKGKNYRGPAGSHGGGLPARVIA